MRKRRKAIISVISLLVVFGIVSIAFWPIGKRDNHVIAIMEEIYREAMRARSNGTVDSERVVVAIVDNISGEDITYQEKSGAKQPLRLLTQLHTGDVVYLSDPNSVVHLLVGASEHQVISYRDSPYQVPSFGTSPLSSSLSQIKNFILLGKISEREKGTVAAIAR